MTIRKLLVIPVVALGFFVFAPAASAWMAHACVSFGGYTIFESGTATCSTTSGHNLAVAVGDGSDAYVDGGSGNLVMAEGVSSVAYVDSDSKGNLVVAKGEGSLAGVDSQSHGNLVTAKGERSRAVVDSQSHGNLVTATGENSHAVVDSQVHGSLVISKGDSTAVSDGSDRSLVIAEGDGSSADAESGSGNVAIAKNGGEALAGDGSWNTAVALDDSFACAGGFNECRPPCPVSAGASVECVQLTNGGEADGNTAFATNGGAAYAGGVGDYDWNTAIASWSCIASAVYGTHQLDHCGSHSNTNTAP